MGFSTNTSSSITDSINWSKIKWAIGFKADRTQYELNKLYSDAFSDHKTCVTKWDKIKCHYNYKDGLNFYIVLYDSELSGKFLGASDTKYMKIYKYVYQFNTQLIDQIEHVSFFPSFNDLSTFVITIHYKNGETNIFKVNAEKENVENKGRNDMDELPVIVPDHLSDLTEHTLVRPLYFFPTPPPYSNLPKSLIYPLIVSNPDDKQYISLLDQINAKINEMTKLNEIDSFGYIAIKGGKNLIDDVTGYHYQYDKVHEFSNAFNSRDKGDLNIVYSFEFKDALFFENGYRYFACLYSSKEKMDPREIGHVRASSIKLLLELTADEMSKIDKVVFNWKIQDNSLKYIFCNQCIPVVFLDAKNRVINYINSSITNIKTYSIHKRKDSSIIYSGDGNIIQIKNSTELSIHVNGKEWSIIDYDCVKDIPEVHCVKLRQYFLQLVKRVYCDKSDLKTDAHFIKSNDCVNAKKSNPSFENQFKIDKETNRPFAPASTTLRLDSSGNVIGKVESYYRHGQRYKKIEYEKLSVNDEVSGETFRQVTKRKYLIESSAIILKKYIYNEPDSYLPDVIERYFDNVLSHKYFSKVNNEGKSIDNMEPNVILYHPTIFEKQYCSSNYKSQLLKSEGYDKDTNLLTDLKYVCNIVISAVTHYDKDTNKTIYQGNYEQGKLWKERWFDKTPGQLHRPFTQSENKYDDIYKFNQQPAYIEYYKETGGPKLRKWYVNGVPHNQNNDWAYEEYFEDGSIKLQKKYHCGVLHTPVDYEWTIIEYQENPRKLIKRELYQCGQLIKSEHF